MSLLETIVSLSHEFGTETYVRGGGGNTSCKNGSSLWVKPSGTTLRDMTEDGFVELDRARVAELYAAEPPEDASAREALILDLMMAALAGTSTARPSVEAALHDSFPQTYVVHTHPALVNGMTCGRDGQRACAELFPDALWIEYVDPGYTLCLHVRKAMLDYAAREGHAPDVVMLENHGVFVAGESADAIRATYASIMDALGAHYAAQGVSDALAIGPAPDDDDVKLVHGALRTLLGEAGSVVSSAGNFAPPAGPLTPDHIVYSRSYPLDGEVTEEQIAAYREAHGGTPSVVRTANAVFGVSESEKAAGLALEFAIDGALVAQLTAAFGGVQYMSDRARAFIENWEVEAYRKKVSAG